MLLALFLGGHCHAGADIQTMTQRAGRIFNTGNIVADVTHQLTIIAIVGAHPLSGEEAVLHQSGVYNCTCVTLGKNKTVTVGIFRILGVEFDNATAVQNGHNVCGGEHAADVSALAYIAHVKAILSDALSQIFVFFIHRFCHPPAY